MTHEAFAERIIAMQARLYRVSAGILSQHADQEDAVQSCIEKAWRKRALLRDEGRFDAWVTQILVNEWKSICQGVFYPFLIKMERFAIASNLSTENMVRFL